MANTGVVAVMGPNFCLPYFVELTITRKGFSLSGGDFKITDAAGRVIFRVNGVFFSLRERRVLLDANGNPLISAQQKIVSLHERWKVFRGDSSSSNDLLFSAKRSSLLQLKTTLHVFLASNSEENHCDFKVKGSFFKKSCTVYSGGKDSTPIAKMKKEKGKFVVNVYPGVDYAFIAALIVVLHEINTAGDSKGIKKVIDGGITLLSGITLPTGSS